jgi:surface-anchored protein
LGVHAHANWAFSAEGVYRITMTQTATLAGGRRSSDTETLVIAVGNVDPKTAITRAAGCGTAATALFLPDLPGATRLAAAQAEAQAAQVAESDPDQRAVGSDQPPASPATGLTAPEAATARKSLVPSLFAILGGLLLVGAAGTGAAWWRARRRV